MLSLILFSNSCGLSEEEIIRQQKEDEKTAQNNQIRTDFQSNYNLALNALIKGYDLNDIYTKDEKLSELLKIDNIQPTFIYFSDIFPENKKFRNCLEVTGSEFSIKKAEVIFKKALSKKFLISEVDNAELGKYDFNNNYFILYADAVNSKEHLAPSYRKYGLEIPLGSRPDNSFFTLKNPETLEHKIKVSVEEAELFKENFPRIKSIVLFKLGKAQAIEEFEEECTKRVYDKCIQRKKISFKIKKIELIPERYIYYTELSGYKDEDSRKALLIYTNFTYNE